MRDNMAAFLSNQLDFIFFFYGLAFILLGVTCFAITKNRDRGESWAVLGWFAVAHGAGEWLDLTALIIGDTLAFGVARTALMTGSFVLLMEFARLEAIRFGVRLPGRWVYVPSVLAVALAGVAGGLDVAGVFACYTVGFVGATAVWYLSDMLANFPALRNGFRFLPAWDSRSMLSLPVRWFRLRRSGQRLCSTTPGSPILPEPRSN
jgi:hypothetical protein